jgi:hypothetical protein
MTDVTSQPARGWRGRRVRLFLVLAALLVLVAYVGVDLWAGHRVNVVVARLEKQYGRLDRVGGVERPPAGDNRAHVVGAAAVLIEDLNFGKFLDAYRRFVQSGASAPVPADLRTFVEDNRLALRVADEARTRHHSEWDYPFDPPPLLAIRTLGQASYFDALLNLEAGRPDDAAKAIATGLAVSGSLRQQPALLVQLIRISVAMNQCEAVHRLVIQSEPSKASLEDLAKWLSENKTPDPARVGIISEMKHFNAAFMRLENGTLLEYGTFQPEMAELQPLVAGPAWRIKSEPPFWFGPLARLERPLIRVARARYLQRVGELLDVYAGPRPRPAFPPSSAGPLGLAWILDMSRGLERAIEGFDKFNSILSATELAVALRRFRLDHGTYPDELSALVPVYVARVPIDPFTGQPPVYARQGDGFHLHAEGGKYAPTVMASALDWTVPK